MGGKKAARLQDSHPVPKVAPVLSIVVNETLWKHALAVAGGDPKRIQIISHDTVIIR